jgi:acyl dehydratase
MTLYFEDFRPGDRREFGDCLVTREAIVAFARQYDPQPFHLDEERGRLSLLGGLAASGWHTVGLLMRMNCDNYLLDSSTLGGPGVAEIRWLKPVRPGDRLHARSEVLDARASRSRPAMGLVRMLWAALNQAGETVMTLDMMIMFSRRGTSLPASPAPRRALPSRPPQAFANPDPPPFFEDVVPGSRRQLGEHLFTVPDIQQFASCFDPQPFHLDPEKARHGPFGGLVASGWQTACEWMRLMVEDRRCGGLPETGPSPGVRDLKWRQPVYAGDTVSFDTTVVDKRPTGRPGWGLVISHNSGTNQNQEKVFEFSAAVFWPRREMA